MWNEHAILSQVGPNPDTGPEEAQPTDDLAPLAPSYDTSEASSSEDLLASMISTIPVYDLDLTRVWAGPATDENLGSTALRGGSDELSFHSVHPSSAIEIFAPSRRSEIRYSKRAESSSRQVDLVSCSYPRVISGAFPLVSAPSASDRIVGVEDRGMHAMGRALSGISTVEIKGRSYGSLSPAPISSEPVSPFERDLVGLVDYHAEEAQREGLLAEMASASLHVPVTEESSPQPVQSALSARLTWTERIFGQKGHLPTRTLAGLKDCLTRVLEYTQADSAGITDLASHFKRIGDLIVRAKNAQTVGADDVLLISSLRRWLAATDIDSLETVSALVDIEERWFVSNGVEPGWPAQGEVDLGDWLQLREARQGLLMHAQESRRSLETLLPEAPQSVISEIVDRQVAKFLARLVRRTSLLGAVRSSSL